MDDITDEQIHAAYTEWYPQLKSKNNGCVCNPTEIKILMRLIKLFYKSSTGNYCSQEQKHFLETLVTKNDLYETGYIDRMPTLIAFHLCGYTLDPYFEDDQHCCRILNCKRISETQIVGKIKKLLHKKYDNISIPLDKIYNWRNNNYKFIKSIFETRDMREFSKSKQIYDEWFKEQNPG